MNSQKILKWYQEMGVDEVTGPNARDHLSKTVAKKQQPIESDAKTPQVVSTNHSLQDIMAGARAAADDCTTLVELEQALQNFDGCAIKKTANKTVFGDGSRDAKIMFIGEAPGANEDIQGIPFCGDSGKLLDTMLSFIGLTRARNMYITNSLFWRPPGNRKPTNEEIAICLPFVEKHIALINPELLVLVGSTAVSSVLGINDAMTKMRQKYYEYSNRYITRKIPVAVIFHPSYLLRQPSQKKSMWHDLLKIEEKFIIGNENIVL